MFRFIFALVLLAQALVGRGGGLWLVQAVLAVVCTVSVYSLGPISVLIQTLEQY